MQCFWNVLQKSPENNALVHSTSPIQNNILQEYEEQK